MTRLLAALALAAALGACTIPQDAAVTDIDEPTFVGEASTDDITARAPDSITVFLNVDGHPNIVKVCIDGLAFRTLSATHSGLASPAAERVTEWDADCAEARS